MKNQAVKEKKKVALLSLFAAIFLTSFKLVVGLVTGSLGILSEALHSGLDMVAAAITFFAVRVSDKPGDFDHHYGHGKIENVSALAETLLLLVTCVWIIYEAVHRLTTGEVEIDVNIWSYVVVVSSIIIDVSRSRALNKAAKKHNSQALKADALHFSTDIWSSLVVLLGLICANFGFFIADSLAALGVAIIVISVSFRLGKKSIDVLLDKAPGDATMKIEKILFSVPEIIHYHDLRVREAGAQIFIEVSIHVAPDLNIEQAHIISDKIEEEIKVAVKRAEVHVHVEPEHNGLQNES
ncbi:MAG: cation diffusion facilitator family transporter [Bacteroidetes bacterium]|nr:cation diffusion facilitator family transporter [Bacteroidota bacterium]